MPFDGKTYTAPGRVTPSMPADLGADAGASPLSADETLRLLAKGRALVERGWCEVPFSVDADGIENHDSSNKAAILRGVQFCIAGAMWHVRYSGCDDDAFWKARKLLKKIADQDGVFGITFLNGDTQLAALSAFDRAIAARKAESA